jgi:hypothetical protein
MELAKEGEVIFNKCKGISQHSSTIEAPCKFEPLCKGANMHRNVIEAPMQFFFNPWK